MKSRISITLCLMAMAFTVTSCDKDTVNPTSPNLGSRVKIELMPSADFDWNDVEYVRYTQPHKMVCVDIYDSMQVALNNSPSVWLTSGEYCIDDANDTIQYYNMSYWLPTHVASNTAPFVTTYFVDSTRLVFLLVDMLPNTSVQNSRGKLYYNNTVVYEDSVVNSSDWCYAYYRP